jgi:lipoprotein-anchoring transpeptidase ErfK/SrfK
LENAGKMVEARSLYEKLWKNQRLSPLQRRDVRSRLERLNLKLLFSPADTPETRFHVVKAGDSLYHLSKKNGTTIELIKKINRLSNEVIYPGMKLKIVNRPVSIVVDKKSNKLYLFLDQRPLKSFRVATGINNKTPVGRFKIINKVANPIWYNEGTAVPPESPENILGTRWLGFDAPSYGIHGTKHPDSIGKQESAGCVRMLNRDVEELYDFVPLGTVVTIADGPSEKDGSV